MSHDGFFAQGVTKRQFLQGGAGAAMLAMASGQYAFAAANPADTYDVIVVGAGTAGMPLAIFAAARGAKVLMIEKSGQIGGTLHYSGGQLSAAGSKLQARNGIQDNPDMFFEEVMRLSHGKCNPAVTRLYVDNAAGTLDWLEDIGFTVKPGHPVNGQYHADFQTRRYQSGPEGGISLIKAMLPPLLEAEARGNLTIAMRTGVIELVQGRDKAVTGVVAEDENGARAQYKSRNVVLASGGCMFNPALYQKYNFRQLYGRRVYPFSMGKGLELGVAAGGVVKGGEMAIIARGSVLTDRAYPAPEWTTILVDPRARPPWEMEVNRLGVRYVAEDADIDTLERAQTEQPGMSAFHIFDQEIFDKAPPLMRHQSKEQQISALAFHPLMGQGDTLEALAVKMGLPPKALVQTVKTYNDAVASQNDTAFGRKHMPLPIAKPPFYAIECLGSTVIGHAGLAIDDKLRVIRADGSPIPNLYAAGEVTGAWTTCGDVVIAGGLVTPAITFGRLLGQSMLQFA